MLRVSAFTIFSLLTLQGYKKMRKNSFNPVILHLYLQLTANTHERITLTTLALVCRRATHWTDGATFTFSRK